jgi:hypothetical protein
MVLLREARSGRADDLILGQKKFKSRKEILLFCDLNSNQYYFFIFFYLVFTVCPTKPPYSIISSINLKLWNIKENNILFDILKFQKNQVSQLLVHATASYK